MNKKSLLLVLGALLLATAGAEARDTRHKLPISGVLENPEYAERLEGVQFFFAGQSHPGVAQDFGEFRTNKKTNAFGKSDEFACQWAMLSALLSLHQRALSLGADAVVDIRSNYKNREFASETEYECGAGALMAGVAFKGTIVRLQ